MLIVNVLNSPINMKQYQTLKQNIQYLLALHLPYLLKLNLSIHVQPSNLLHPLTIGYIRIFRMECMSINIMETYNLIIVFQLEDTPWLLSVKCKDQCKNLQLLIL